MITLAYRRRTANRHGVPAPGEEEMVDCQSAYVRDGVLTIVRVNPEWVTEESIPVDLLYEFRIVKRAEPTGPIPPHRQVVGNSAFSAGDGPRGVPPAVASLLSQGLEAWVRLDRGHLRRAWATTDNRVVWLPSADPPNQGLRPLHVGMQGAEEPLPPLTCSSCGAAEMALFHGLCGTCISGR